MARQFSDLLDESRVLLPVRATGKKEIVDELTRFLTERHGCPELYDGLRSGVWERESDMSTGIGRGVALPHAELDLSIAPMAVVGIAPEGVEFDAIDSKPVNIFFMLVCSKENRADRLDLLSRVSRLLRDQSVPERIRSAKTPEEVVEIIRSKEGNL